MHIYENMWLEFRQISHYSEQNNFFHMFGSGRFHSGITSIQNAKIPIEHLYLYLIANKNKIDIHIQLGLEMVLENHEDYVTTELEKQKRRLKEITTTLEVQHKLLRLIVQV